MTSAACCSGFIDAGEPKGSVVEIASIKCYIAIPAQLEHLSTSTSTSTTTTTTTTEDQKDKVQVDCIVIGTDVFGYTLPNVRLIADSYAAQGFLCIVPDSLRGADLPADLMSDMHTLNLNGVPQSEPSSFFRKVGAFGRIFYNMLGFLPKLSFKKSKDLIVDVVNSLPYTQYGKHLRHVGFVGYCFGGKIAIMLAQNEESPIKAFVANHPAPFEVPKDLDALKRPGYFVLAEYDSIKKKQADEIESVLKQRTDLKFGFKLFEGVEHGFAVRGDETNPEVKRKRTEAFDIAVGFFKECFSSPETI